MNAPLSGPGIGLAPAQNLYPSELQNAPYDSGTSRLCLAPGQQIPVPAGNWFIGLGGYLVLQFQDPLNGNWVMGSGAAHTRGLTYIKSDGFNVRIANLTGCPVGATISSRGASYVQATTTVTATGGTSLWQPIVGGALALAGATLVSNGGGYGVAPIAIIPQPPGPSNNANGVGGVAANGYATIASGTVSGFTFTNPGAGYPAAPANFVLLPNPTDPNLSTGITLATVGFSLTNAGGLTAVLCTNPGVPITPANITLAVSGAGVTATVSAIVMQTITAASVLSPGVGYGVGAGAVLSVGGVPAQGTITNNPDALYLAWFPRPAQIGLTPANTSVSIGTPGVVYDGGLFLGTPTAAWIGGPGAGGTVTTIGSVAFVMGSTPDIAVMQPAP